MTFDYNTVTLEAPGDGHPQLVGMDPPGKYRKCGSTETFIATREPSTADTFQNIGIPNKYWWVQVAVDGDLLITGIEGIWFKVGEVAGDAVWYPIGSGGGGTPDAEDVPFTPVGTIAATDVQAAIAEVASEAAAAIAAVSTALSTHEADAADAHDASSVSLLDTAGDFTATDVEGALAELFTLIGTGGASYPGMGGGNRWGGRVCMGD